MTPGFPSIGIRTLVLALRILPRRKTAAALVVQDEGLRGLVRSILAYLGSVLADILSRP